MRYRPVMTLVAVIVAGCGGDPAYFEPTAVNVGPVNTFTGLNVQSSYRAPRYMAMTSRVPLLMRKPDFNGRPIEDADWRIRPSRGQPPGQHEKLLEAGTRFRLLGVRRHDSTFSSGEDVAVLVLTGPFANTQVNAEGLHEGDRTEFDPPLPGLVREVLAAAGVEEPSEEP